MPSALQRAFAFQAVAKVFAKGVKMIDDRMSAANKGILSTARIKEGSKIQTGSQEIKPHSNVGFFVLWVFLRCHFSNDISNILAKTSNFLCF
jgi:hypothetical protein